MLTFVSALCLGVSELHQKHSGTLIAFAVHIHVCPYTCLMMPLLSLYVGSFSIQVHNFCGPSFSAAACVLVCFIYWLSTSVCNERIGLLNVHKVVDP